MRWQNAILPTSAGARRSLDAKTGTSLKSCLRSIAGRYGDCKVCIEPLMCGKAITGLQVLC